MKTVLLVIDGMAPRRNIFDYALQFCQRIKAELSILQIVDTRRDCMEKVRKKAGMARNYFERAMMATTFAEANAPEIAEAILFRARDNTRKVLPEIAKPGTLSGYALLSGDIRKEAVDYVRKHRDVVVAILDTPKEEGHCEGEEERETVSAAITRQIAVPLVVAKDLKPLPS